MSESSPRLLVLIRIFSAVIASIAGAEMFARSYGPLAATLVALGIFAISYAIGLAVAFPLVDRGALDNTIIERGCKLDNLIQIAHNVRIGAHTAIAACVGIAGSTVIGRYCRISGGVGVIGHLKIVDNVTITAMSLVTKDIDTAGVYSSGTPLLENSKWLKNNVRYKTLDKLARAVTRLEKKCSR